MKKSKILNRKSSSVLNISVRHPLQTKISNLKTDERRLEIGREAHATKGVEAFDHAQQNTTNDARIESGD